MDPFTQRLMDRARARREDLEKRMAEQSMPRKRAVPFGENTAENMPSPPTSQDDGMYNSPKRQCVREREKEIKEDTPAIQGVRARCDAIATTEHGQMNVDDYVPPLRRHAEPEFTTGNAAPRSAPSGRRNRFAALASTINNWEDDLSHHNIKPVEEKPKKVWQQPKSVNEPSSSKPVVSNDEGPPKPSRTFQHRDQAHRSPVKEERKVVSSITVTLGNNSPKAVALKVVSGTTTPVSPSLKGNLEFVPGTTTCVSPSLSKISSGGNLNRSPQPFRSTAAGSSSRAARSPVKEVVNASNEPTVQPVSSRMAAWKQASDGGEKAEEDEPTKTPVAARKGLWEQKITLAEKEKKESPVKPGQTACSTRPQSGVVMREKSGRASRDPTEESVHNRMSLWEKRVTENQKDGSPARQRPMSANFKAGVSQRAAEMQGRRQSPVKSLAPVSENSPEKLGPATRSLADRLAGMQQGWQNNEIAEKIKQQKQSELAMLQNRWKNGLPTLQGEPEAEAEQAEAEPQPRVTSASGPPAPPPLPSSPRGKVTSLPATPKREAAREVIRTDFENKLRAMGFDMHSTADVGKVAVVDLKAQKQKEAEVKARTEADKNRPKSQVKVVGVSESRTTTTSFGQERVSTKTVMTPGPESHTSSLTTTLSSRQPSSAGTSIYNLIKNKVPATPSGSSASQYRAYQASSKHNDSFESASSSFTEEEQTEDEQFRAPSSGRQVQRTTSHASAYSSSSEYSEQTDYTEDTEGQEEEGTEAYTEEEEEEDYSEEEEGSEEEGEINDLLEEAMDDTVTTETETESDYPVVASRLPASRQTVQHQHSQRSHYSQHATQSRREEQQEFRVPQPQPRRRDNNQRVTFASSVPQGLTSSSTGTTSGSCTSSGASSAESDTDDQRTAYSIDMYRRGTSQRKGPVPKMTIVRQSEHTKRASVQEEPLPHIPEKSVRKRLQELQEMVGQEQSVVHQTSNALNQCCGTNSAFAGSVEAVECHRLLLVACKKREGYLMEMTRLREGHPDPSECGPKGSLTISDIRLPLKADFTRRIGTPADTAQHFFVCILRNGAHTIVTQMVSTHDAMVRDTLDIPNMIKMNDISQDFKFNLEIYSMSISREQNVPTPKKKSKSATPKKGLFGGLKPSTPRSMQSPGGPNAVRSTNFTQIANLPISIRSLNKSHFSLDRVPYASPLQGTIHLTLHCLMESCIEERGFLTMFDDVGGFGAWHRRWCVLRKNVLSFWKYPDDENIKDPIGYIDLKACITDRVGLIPRDICARPNTFELMTVRRQHRGDSNTLVTRCVNTMTTTRHQLSADTKEDRMAWCDILNRALTSLRTWNADAMRPVKMQ